MLEVVLVIAVLGIVSSIGAEIIANMYSSYVLQRGQHRASLKTEIAATQIANRLSHAIPNTVIRRVGVNGAPENIVDPLLQNPDAYNVLQWVGADSDSFEAHTIASRLPGWSGFCDLDASAGNQLVTRGSNLALFSTIMTSLGGAVNGSAVYFTGYENTPSIVTGVLGETITLAATPANWVEQYKLAWSSYALAIEGGDLYLYHGFAPTPNAAIPAPTELNRSLILEGVTTFKFRGDGRTIRFKICRSENIGEDFNVTSCKEKAVF